MVEVDKQIRLTAEVRVSVVVPSYNSEETIAPCLESVLRQKCEVPFEMIVVDSSGDRTPDIVRQRFPEVNVLHLTHRTEPGPARNMGVKVARGEVIAFLDSDCIAGEGWLTTIWQILSTNDYAATGGPVCNGNPGTLASWAGYLSEFSEWLPHKKERAVPHIPTCNIAYKKFVFERYGGFAEGLYPYEDHHFNSLLSREGEKILFSPDIWVKHFQRATVYGFLAHQWLRGKAGAKVRKALHLPDAFTVRFPFLAPLVFLPKRIGAIGLRVLKRNPAGILLYILSFPLLVLGAAFWVGGFVQEARRS